MRGGVGVLATVEDVALHLKSGSRERLPRQAKYRARRQLEEDGSLVPWVVLPLTTC